MSEDLLPIGRFAQLCRLSVKQLRHYDELGLLTPDWVDPDSGYRYYRPAQAGRALSIGLLRSLDVPLPAIARVLDGTDVAETLGSVRDRMEADLERRRRALAAMESVLADGLPKVEVTVATEPARNVLITREPATQATIAEATGRCVTHLFETLAGRIPIGPMVGLFPLELTDDEFLVRVAAEAEGATDVLPGGSFATATHVGPYVTINLTAHGLLAWLGGRGHIPRGPVREVYLTNPTDTPPDRLVTQVMIRLEENQ